MAKNSDMSVTAHRIRWGLGLLILLLLVLGAYQLRRSWQAQESANQAPAWPELALPQLADAARMGPSQWRGQPRVVHLWASSCLSCREEAPHMLALAATLRAEGRADLLIGLNADAKSQDAINYLAYFGNPYWTSLVDADGELQRRLGSGKPPQTWVLNAQGRIVFQFSGPLNAEVIGREILPRIKE